MRIGLFTNAYKPIISGVVNSIELIRRGMKKRGHNVYIFAPNFRGYRDTEAGVFRFASVSLTSQVQFPLAIPYSFKLYTIIEKIGLDVIHSHHPFLLGDVAAYFAKKLNVPLVFTFHTQYEKYSHYIPFPQDLVKMVTRELVIKYTEKCDLIICPSPTIIPLLEKYEVQTPIKVIPNAIDLEQFKDSNPQVVREKYNLSEQEKVLLFVGRISVEKNLEFMIKAFKRASAEVEEARLMIVGEGPHLENLKKMVKEEEIDDRVIFTGAVDYSSIPDYYGVGYAHLITSTTEVKPLALLEALSAGLPVVAVSAPGAEDTVNHDFDGILTEEDLDEYAKALIRILKDTQLRDRLSSGAAKTSEQYSIDTNAERLECLYESLIQEKKTKITRNRLQKGYVQVYTGDGKGKTTAALGLALRASGFGIKTAIIQFLKGRYDYGEVRALKKIPEISLYQFGRKEFVYRGKEKKIDYQQAKAALKKAKEIIKDPEISIIILDEVNVAVEMELITIEDVLEIIESRQEHQEVILTGRGAPGEFIQKADLVTRMEAVKHYYDTMKLNARRGIEF